MKEYIVKADCAYTNGVQELIRCKDCKYCNKHDYMCEHPNECGNEDTRNQCNPEWFCADAERRDKNEG